MNSAQRRRMVRKEHPGLLVDIATLRFLGCSNKALAGMRLVLKTQRPDFEDFKYIRRHVRALKNGIDSWNMHEESSK